MSFQRNLAEPIARHRDVALMPCVCVCVHVCLCVCICVCVEAQKNSRYAGATDAKCKSARMHFSAIKRHTDSFSPGLANAVRRLRNKSVYVYVYLYTYVFVLFLLFFFKYVQ